MIHPIDLMTEAESNDMLTSCLNAVKGVVPKDTAFIVIVAPFGDRPPEEIGGLYGSNVVPEDACRLMRETAARIEYRKRNGGLHGRPQR